MGLFSYDKNQKAFVAEINGVRFCCEEIASEYEAHSKELADIYAKKLPDIVCFMLDEVCSIYGNVSETQLTQSLGTPLVDLDNNTITYLEQSLDDCHIFELEFGGLFEKFYYFTIDG